MYASVCETLAPWPPASGGVGWSSLIASPAEQFVCSDSDTARAAEPPTRPPTPIRSQTARWAKINKLPGLNQYCLPQLRRQRQPRRPHRPRRARPEKDGHGPCGNHRADLGRRRRSRALTGQAVHAGQGRDPRPPHLDSVLLLFFTFKPLALYRGLIIKAPTTLFFLVL